MATATGTYIAVDEIRATLGSTTANYVSELRATGDTTTAQLVRRMWLNDSSNILTMVWDVWNTVLTATIENMPSEGGNVEDYLSVSSYGTDVNGEPHDLGYSFSPEYIDPTTSGSTTTKPVTVTQEGSGESVQLTAYIAGRVAVDTTYKTPTVTSTSISSVPASGNVTRYLTVYWSQEKVITYDNGTTSISTVTGSSVATVTNGSSGTGVGAYISGGGVYVPSAGTTYYTSQRTAFTISKFTFTANEVSSGTVSWTVYVYQDANNRKSTTEYKVTCGAANTDTLLGTGGTFSFSAKCDERYHYEYDSTEEEYTEWTGSSAKVTYSNGVTKVSTSSFTGSATITATVGENSYSYARSPRVTVTATGGGEPDYAQVTQNAISYVFSRSNYTSGTVSVAGTASSITLDITSTRDGAAWVFDETDVEVSISADVTVTPDSYSGNTGLYHVVVAMGENGSTARTFTVEITQPTSGKTLTYTVNQAAVTASFPISNVWKFPNGQYCTSNGWYLGQVATGGTTNGRPVSHIVAVTTKANAQAASIYANFTYTYNPSDAAGNRSGSINQSFSYTAGATISVNGTTYYGVILVTGFPAISQGTVSDFSVSKT